MGSSCSLCDSLAMPTTTHTFVETRGFTAHVAQCGNGPPLFLLHGWPEFWATWEPMFERLGDNYRLIAPDFRGFGESGNPTPGRTDQAGADVLADDIAALMDKLGVARAGFVGHDVGGALMQPLARNAAERLAGLFFFDFVYPGIGPRMAEPARLNNIWYQSFHQMPMAPALVGASRDTCKAYIGHFLRHWAWRKDAFHDVIDIFVDNFLKPGNLSNIAAQTAVIAIVAIGQHLVILTRGIDLSVGSVVALAGLGAAMVAKGGLESRFAVGAEAEAQGWGWPAALLASCLIGTACGWLQGQAITRLKVPPFVVTLGGMSAFRGLALYMAGGGPISGFDEAYRWWGQGYVGPVPVPVIIFLAFAVLAHFVLTSTRYGRSVYAVGGNPEAARLSGLDVDRITTSVYVIIGFMAGLGGFVLSARLNSAEAVAGLTYELTVIASVVIGGTSLFGGIGTIFGTVVGTLLIGVVLNGLVLNNVSSYVQQVIIGVIIVLAVAFDTFAKSRRRRA